MPALRSIVAIGLLAVSSGLSAPASQNLSLHLARRKKPSKAKVAQEQPVPVPPPTPLTPAEMPAVAPQVTYREGNLTIVADNCVLGDVLRAVRAQTGAVIDVPANATERVALRLGPGPPREVMAELLNGSHFDYVLLGTAATPNALAQVILMNKTLPGPNDVAGGQKSFAAPPPNRPVAEEPAATDEDTEGEADNGDQQDEQPQAAPTSAPPQNPAVKTPEQLLQELQRQQQQLQQQQQQGQPEAPPDQN